MTQAPAEVAHRFVEAWNRRDLDAVLALVTDDCMFDSAHERPGGPVRGRPALDAVWGEVLERASGEFVIERTIAVEEAVALEWTLRGSDVGEVRGVDILTVRDGLVAIKSGYVKVRATHAGG